MRGHTFHLKVSQGGNHFCENGFKVIYNLYVTSIVPGPAGVGPAGDRGGQADGLRRLLPLQRRRAQRSEGRPGEVVHQ